ncbi:GNAT family N-acetyltransferase [Arthrobacter sp. HS15c]|uniref:GNAT family N-acetyltransferase n=1 Tax=Arthrobacter sp. HS15c TaxID=3230279 RepID=UPI0034657E54
MTPEEIIPLVTGRLTLRPVEMRDEAAIHGFRGDPVATRYLSHGPLTAEANRERLEEVLALRTASTSQWFNVGWAITLRTTGEVVGDARTWNSTVLDAAGVLSAGKHPFQHAALGYILHPDHHHHGYGREAAAALVNWLFAERGISTIVARAYEPNTPSIRLLRSLGFKPDAAAPTGPDSTGKGYPMLMFHLDSPRPSTA